MRQEKQYKIIKESYETALLTAEKIGEYVDTIIKMHQEIVVLNQYYKSPNKNQLVAPFRPYSIINHNSVGVNLNKICDKLSKYKTKFVNGEEVCEGGK